MVAIHVQGVLRDEGRRIRRVRQPLDAARPDLLTHRVRCVDEVEQAAGSGVDDGCHVYLGPARVVLAGGEKQPLATRMGGQPVTAPPCHDRSRQRRVVRLRDEQEMVRVGANDHSGLTLFYWWRRLHR